MDRAQLLAGIRTDADAVMRRLRRVPDQAFSLPTPCAAWDVAHLLAHLHRDFERVGQAVASAADQPPDHDRVSYWLYDRPENQVRTQERARAAVQELGSPTAIVDAFDAMVAEALDLATGAAPGLVVRLTWGPVIDLDEFLATRWLELAVHSLDLAVALGHDDDVSADGLALVVDILDRLAGRPLSQEGGGWPAPAYIRAATGRAALSAEDGARLGAAMAARFPLLA